MDRAESPSFDPVAVVGLGLIGGSFALALRRFGFRGRILGVSRPASLREAQRLGAIDEGFPYSELASVAAQSRLVLLATPISRIIEQIEALGAAGDRLAPGTVITDVGSTKSKILDCARRSLPAHVRFIGGHPLAGSEEQGMRAAEPLLFENAYYVLTPGAGVGDEEVARLGTFIGLTGARVIVLDANVHDRVAAAISHVPQLLAVALVRSLDELAEEREDAELLAAGGFRDMTRIASSPFAVWRDILATNEDIVREALRRIARRIESLAEDFDLARLEAEFAKAASTREVLPKASKGFLSRLWDLRVVVPDSPGIIAGISSHLYAKGINIKDIEVLKVREGETGSVRLAFASREIALEARMELEKAGYPSRLRE